MRRASRPRQGEVNARRGPQMTRTTPFHPWGPCPTSAPRPVPKALAFKPPVACTYRLDFPNFHSSTRSSQEGRVPETGLEGARGQ